MFDLELLPHPLHIDLALCLCLSNDLEGGKIFLNKEAPKFEPQKYFDSKHQEFDAEGIHDKHGRWSEVIETKGEYILIKMIH
jgi:hypothetical protein